jgi:hypothetical protein
MLLMVRRVERPFFNVTFWATLLVESTWLPKARLVGDTVTLWAEPGTTATKRIRETSNALKSPTVTAFTSTSLQRTQLESTGACSATLRAA